MTLRISLGAGRLGAVCPGAGRLCAWRSGAVLLACLGTGARPAAAGELAPDCPPEEWICDVAPRPLEPAPPADATPPVDTPPADTVPAAPAQMDLEPGAAPDSVDGAPPAFGFERSSPWSIHLRAEGILLSGRNAEAVGLGGVGASLRYEFNPIATLDLGLDSLLGKDYEARDRAETSLSGSVLLYLNPESPLRTYGIFGIHYDVARVDLGGYEQTWTYFGGQAGFGLDVRLDRRVALDFDLIGFMRGRTDSRAAREPEFSDGKGRQTNTGGGALFRAGVALRW